MHKPVCIVQGGQPWPTNHGYFLFAEKLETGLSFCIPLNFEQQGYNVLSFIVATELIC
jgi:hypothetical protein